MEVTEITAPETKYQPTDAQLERSKAIRKFNRRFVFAPVGLFGLFFLGSVGFLIYLALFARDNVGVNIMSGYADALIILATCPLLLLCALFPGLFVFASAKARGQNFNIVRSLSQIIWRLENVLGTMHALIGRINQAIVRPFVLIQAIYAFIQALARQIGSLFR